VDLLVGDPSRAKRVLGWEPRTTFEQLVSIMVEADLEEARREAHGMTYAVGER
jgi:GDPmannose 4,6-dehydratase